METELAWLLLKLGSLQARQTHVDRNQDLATEGLCLNEITLPSYPTLERG